MADRVLNALIKFRTEYDSAATQRLLASQVQLEREVQKTTRAVTAQQNALNRYSQQQRQSTAVVTQSRGNFAQLGAQLNDFTVQVGSGQNALVALSNQLGQIGFAAQAAGGRFAGLGRILLSGPGAAITAVLALSPALIKFLKDSEKGSDDLRRSLGLTAKEFEDFNNKGRTFTDIIVGAGQQAYEQFELVRKTVVGIRAAAEAAEEAIAFITKAWRNNIVGFLALFKSVGVTAQNVVTFAKYAYDLTKSLSGGPIPAQPTYESNDFLDNYRKTQIELDKFLDGADAKATARFRKRAEEEAATIIAARTSSAAVVKAANDNQNALDAYAEQLRSTAVAWADLSTYERQFLNNADFEARINAVAESLKTAADSMTYFERSGREAQRVWAEMQEAAAKAAFPVQEFADKFAAAAVSIATGSQSIKSAIADMVSFVLKELAKIAISKFVASIFGGAAADGAAFDKGGNPTGIYAKGGVIGSQQKFATGGIVNRPTNFAFAAGGVPRIGLMGEAGPEAIMPLKRGRNGKLGVEASGMTVNVYNQTGANVTTETGPDGSLEVYITQAQRKMADDIRRGGNILSSAMERTYGLTRGGGGI
jgi:hypothetical protein